MSLFERNQEEMAETVKKPGTGEKLSPALRAVRDMPLHLSEEDYKRAMQGNVLTREISEDAFLRIAKSFIAVLEGHKKLTDFVIPNNMLNELARILNRRVLAESPNLPRFQEAMAELRSKFSTLK